jgi:hypothetical protein
VAEERWTAWFDDLAISFAKGESVLRGRAEDHAALYGLIARLRDLAVPLVAVRVLDRDAQVKMRRQNRRYDLMINLLLMVAYALLLGGLVAMTVFVAPMINTAMALTLLFASLAALAHAFWLWKEQPWWRWTFYFFVGAAAISFLVYIPVSGIMSTALALAVTLLFLAGGVIYLIYALRRRAEGVRESLVDWGGLRGERSAGATPHNEAAHIDSDTAD